MNNVQLVGRFTRDPEVRYSTGERSIAIARFTLAIDRRFKSEEGNQTADFISCVAFGKTAEFIEKYFYKGQRIGLVGRIQTGSYTNQEGKMVYTTDVVAEAVEFVESKNQNRDLNSAGANDEFMRIPDDVDDDGLPFN